MALGHVSAVRDVFIAKSGSCEGHDGLPSSVELQTAAMPQPCACIASCIRCIPWSCGSADSLRHCLWRGVPVCNRHALRGVFCAHYRLRQPKFLAKWKWFCLASLTLLHQRRPLLQEILSGVLCGLSLIVSQLCLSEHHSPWVCGSIWKKALVYSPFAGRV